MNHSEYKKILTETFSPHHAINVNQSLDFDPNPDDNIDPLKVANNRLQLIKNTIEEILDDDQITNSDDVLITR